MRWSSKKGQTYGLGYRIICKSINSVPLAGTVFFELCFRALVLRILPGASILPGNVLKMQIPVSYIESKHWSGTSNLIF